MKIIPTHLDVVSVKKAMLSDSEHVRYRVYQSPTEYIAVIAESALLALRIAGVKNPYKVVRDVPTNAVSIEKGKLKMLEASEHVPLPVKQVIDEVMKIETAEAHDPADDFVSMQLVDIHKKKIPNIGIISRADGMKFFGVADDAPTLSAPEPMPAYVAPEAPPISIEAPEPVPNQQGEALSQEEIAKLLGDA